MISHWSKITLLVTLISLLAGGLIFAAKIKAIDTTIENNANVENNLNTNANSGGNNSQGGQITTGDAAAGSIITNIVNTNVVKCCVTPTPPSEPTATPTPTEPTATPTPGPGGGGGEGQAAGGEGGVDGAAVSAPQGEVLGLAAASGRGWDAWFFYLLGSLCLILGAKLTTGKRFIFV